ncbi:MAG: hypothetical protein HY716_02480 [Planctomycetes bacterium]|nr:hypothetical protein [Planctomycetota bacterium]
MTHPREAHVGWVLIIQYVNCFFFGAEGDKTPAALLLLEGESRYVWVRLTLDDTASESSDPTTMTEITLTSVNPPTPGTVNDGEGEDIDEQTSTGNSTGGCGSIGVDLLWMIILVPKCLTKMGSRFGSAKRRPPGGKVHDVSAA